MKKLIVVGVLFIVDAFLAIVYFSMSVSYNNKNVELMELINAQNKKIELHFDNTFKSIKQIANVADKAAETFKEIYVPLMEQRYGNDNNVMMKWITESNPQFDNSLYKKLADVIEAKRNELTNEQDKLADYIRQRNVYIKKFPNSFFISDKSEIKGTFITSTKAKEAIETGIDDELEVFDKDSSK